MNVKRMQIWFISLLILCSAQLRAAVDPDYPINLINPNTKDRYTILVTKNITKQRAVEEAIYISSFLNLSIYIVQTTDNYSVYAGYFVNQIDAPHYQSVLKHSGYRKASIQRKDWPEEQQAAIFNPEYADRYAIPEERSTSQLRENATKKIGVITKPSADLWVAVPNQPRLEKQLREAWSYLSQNNYTDACSLFSQLREEKLIRAQATYGLAICYHRSSNPSRSVPLFTELLINEIRVEHILLPLSQDLESLDRHEEAKTYRERYENIHQDKWLDYQGEESFRLQVVQAIETKDEQTLTILLNNHKTLLENCQAIDSFYKSAHYLRINGNRKKAKTLYEDMLEACPDKWHLRVGLLYAISNLSGLSQSINLINDEKGRKGAPTHYKSRLDTLLFSLKVRAANAHPKGSNASLDAFQKLNDEYPNNAMILASIGWWHYQNDQFESALKYFEKSKTIKPSGDIKKGILYCHIQLGNTDKALQLAGEQNLKSVQLDILKEKIGRIEVKDPGVPELADKILALEPGHLPTKKTLAWHYFETEYYSKSKQLFSSLHQQQPDDISLLKGYVYSLLRLGEIDETEALLSTTETSDSDIDDVAAGIYMEKAVGHYEQENYSDALNYINKYLKSQPADQDALALRSWIHFHQNERQKAIQDLEQVWQSNPSKENTQSLAFLYKSQYKTDPNYTKYKEFLSNLETSDNPDWQSTAANEYANDNNPITAAQISQDTEASYSNSDALHAHLAFEYRDKSGDKGTSKWQSFSTYLGADIYSEQGKQWRLQLGWEKIRSGSLPPLPFIGRAFLRNDPGQPTQLHHTSDTAKRIWLEYWSERQILEYASIGTTSLNSLVSTMPVFELSGSFSTDLMGKRKLPYWNLHQRLVEESLLSYIGQYDPYTQDEWGRVLETGATIGHQWQLTNSYWLTGSLHGDYYWGENIWENWSIEANASIGKTEFFESYQRSLGLYTNLVHYDKNSNFFTYGHGGYYSPQILIGLGPFMAFEAHRKNTDFWWKAETSFGGFYESLDGAPLYPLDTGDLRATGSYASDSGFGIGAQIKLQYRKLWTRYFETSGFIDWRKSPDYDEARIQTTFRIYFEPRNALTTFDVYDRLDLP